MDKGQLLQQRGRRDNLLNKTVWLIARYWFDVDILEPVFEKLMIQGFDAYLGAPPYVTRRGRWQDRWLLHTKHPPNKVDAYFFCGEAEGEKNKGILIPHSLGDIHINTIIKSHFVSGQFWADYVRHHLDSDSERVKITGWSKLDFLFQPDRKSVIMKKTASKYKLDELPYDKTVLYTPTSHFASDRNGFDDLIEPLLDAISQLGVNILIKVHSGGDIIINHSTGDFRCSKWCQWRKAEKIMREAEKRDNIRWIPGSENVGYLYPFGDALISDVASSLWEFMVMDKPSVQVGGLDLKKKRKEFLEGNRFSEGHWRAFGGVVPLIFENLPKVEPLKNVIGEAIDNPKLGQSEREEWKKLMFHKLDGRASERVVENMVEVMGW